MAEPNCKKCKVLRAFGEMHDTVSLCPLHAAAPELLKELKSIADGFERCMILAGSAVEMANLRTAAAREPNKMAEGK
jgi:hypothetical protein